MDQNYSFVNGNISELLKMSKQFQNNMRQELSRQETYSSNIAEGCSSDWDKSSNPYVRHIVADYLDSGLNVNGKSVEVEVERDFAKSLKQMEQVKSTRQVKERNIPHTNQPVAVSKKAKSKTIRAETPQYLSKRQGKPLMSSKHNLESSKSLLKPQTSSTTVHRLPLQRFAGTLSGSIDFSKEHPDLELDTSSSRRTLFPRRVYRGTGCVSPEMVSINLAAAEEKAPIGKEETWKEVLAKNPTKVKPQRVLRLNKSVADLDNCKLVPRFNESKGVNVISTPGRGLFQIEKQTETLVKHEKYNQQCFPVMYVRPEYQVQRVASIAIHGDNRTSYGPEENGSVNVKYVECIHKEKQDHEVRSSLPKDEEHVKPSDDTPNAEPLVQVECSDDTLNVQPLVQVQCSNDTPNVEPLVQVQCSDDTPNIEPLVQVQCAPREKNKYFKALEITELLNNSSISSDYSSSTSKSSSKRPSRCSSSSKYSRHSSKSKQSNSTSSLNDVQHIIDEMLSSSERPPSPPTKEHKRTPPTQREVYVQTESKRTPTPPPPSQRAVYVQTDNTANAATSPTPPVLTPPIIIANTPNHPADVSPTKPADDIYMDDDFISKIFDRIRNDLPNALQAFKTRNTTTPRETASPHSNEEQAQSQMNHYQTSTANDTPNVEIEPRLSRVEVQPHTMLEMPPPVQNPRFPQNPLFARTINKIKSSTVHDAPTAIDEAKEETHRHLTDAEIKRAVKVFLDSLDGGDERKSIIRDGGDRARFMLSRSELLSSRVMTFRRADSSDTSNSCSSRGSSKSSSYSGKRNVKRQSNLLAGRGVSRTSTTTSVYSSDLETESDVTIDPQSNKATENSLSEGEVLSMGEVS